MIEDICTAFEGRPDFARLFERLEVGSVTNLSDLWASVDQIAEV